MPTYGMICFFLIVLFLIATILSVGKKKVKYRQEVIDKYKPLALDIINNNNEIATARIKHKIVCLITVLSIFIIVISIGFVMYNKLFIIGIIIGAILLILAYKEDTKKVLFDEIFPLILKNYNESIKYNHYSGISYGQYARARFEYFDRFHSEDLITGTICNCNYEMSEVHTEREYKDKDGHTHYRTIFKGAFAQVNINKNFKCSINIVNNKIKLFNRDKYVTIDNEAFEKIFDVFTDDKILAMRLLTPDVTTKMIDLYNETGIYFEIKIIENILYIRLYTSSIMEINFSNPNKEANQLAISIAQLDSIYTIMNSFITEIERIDV